MDQLVIALWVFLPAGLANMAPVFASKLPYLQNWNTPIDNGLSYKGKRLLGSNKTWRGLVFGVMVAIVTGFIQTRFYQPVMYQTSLSLTIVASGLMGLGALIGDAVESFFKRQRSIPSGVSWFPFDQLDYVVGGLIFLSPFLGLNLSLYFAIMMIWFLLHLITAFLGYLLHMKDRPI